MWPFSRKIETKASEAGAAVSINVLGRPVWTPRNYENFAREAYIQNPVAMACIKLIASNAASVKWLLYDRAGEEIPDHPLITLLRHPNPVNGAAQLWEAVFAYLLLAGNSYVEMVRPKGRPPTELWALRPDRVKVIPGQYGLPAGYSYEVPGREVKWQVDPMNGRSPVLHLKEFHPANDWYGMARTEPAAFAVDRHTAASAHNKALLDNGARPSGALVFKPVKGEGGSEVAAPDAVIAAAGEHLKEHTGPINAGRPFIFGGNVDWLEMGISPKDMDFGDGKNDAARDICLAYGVPHLLIVPGSATYSNMRDAELQLWETTILPLVNVLVDRLNVWLAPLFGDGLRLDFDSDEISALEPRRESKRASTVELLDKGLLTLDEARAALQYDPWDSRAVRKVDASVLSALIGGIDQMGYTPLVRYCLSVGLIDPGMTDEQAVLALANDAVSDLTDTDL